MPRTPRTAIALDPITGLPSHISRITDPEEREEAEETVVHGSVADRKRARADRNTKSSEELDRINEKMRLRLSDIEAGVQPGPPGSLKRSPKEEKEETEPYDPHVAAEFARKIARQEKELKLFEDYSSNLSFVIKGYNLGFLGTETTHKVAMMTWMMRPTATIGGMEGLEEATKRLSVGKALIIDGLKSHQEAVDNKAAIDAAEDPASRGTSTFLGISRSHKTKTGHRTTFEQGVLSFAHNVVSSLVGINMGLGQLSDIVEKPFVIIADKLAGDDRFSKAFTKPRTPVEQRGPAENRDVSREILVALGTGVLTDPKTASVDIEQVSALVHAGEQIKRGFNKMVGLPQDQLSMDRFRAEMPITAHLIDLGGQMVVAHYLTRNPAKWINQLSTGVLSRVAPGLGRPAAKFLSLGLRKPGLTGGIAGAGLGTTQGIIEYSSRVAAGEHTENIPAFFAGKALQGAAGGFFIATLFLGKPYGAQQRVFHDMALRETLLPVGELAKTSVLQRARMWGLSHMFSPRMTVGHMMESGALGAGFHASSAFSEGKSPLEALKAGLHAVPEWMAFDLAFARMGSAVRWGAHVTDFRKNLTRIVGDFQDMSRGGWIDTVRGQLQASATLTKASQVGGAAGVGAAVGAGTAQVMGEDPKLGAIIGAGAAGVWALPSIYQLAPLLSHKLLVKVAEGKMAALNAKDISELAEVSVHVAASKTAAKMNDAERYIWMRAVGRLTPSHPISSLAHEIGQPQPDALIRNLKFRMKEKYKELHQVAPSMELSANPKELAAQIRLTAEIMGLREQEAQVYRMLDRLRLSRINVEAEVYGTMTPERSFSLKFTRNKRTKEITREHERAYNRLEAIQRHDQNQIVARDIMAEARINAKRNRIANARTATTEAEELGHIREEVNNLLNRRISIANAATKDMSTPQLLAEISKATGESVDEVAKRLSPPFTTPGLARIMDNPALREELNYLRANTTTPGLAITKQVRRRQGLTSEHKRDLTALDGMWDDIDDLLAANEAGQRILPEDLRKILRRFGSGKVTGEAGGIMTADFPFIGTLSDFAPALLKRAQLFLKDYKPNLAILPVAIGAPLASSAAFVGEDGFDTYVDPDTGETRATWMGNLQAFAALASLGILLSKPGIPIKVSGLPKHIRALLQRQESKITEFNMGSMTEKVTRRFKGAGQEPGGQPREAIFGLVETGNAFVHPGQFHLMPSERILRQMDGHALIFSMHNHPIDVEATRALIGNTKRFRLPNIERGSLETTVTGQPTHRVVGWRKGTPQTAEDLIEGEIIMNSMPSPGDVRFFTRYASRDVPLFFGIVTPIEGKVTLLSFSRPSEVHHTLRQAGSSTPPFGISSLLKDRHGPVAVGRRRDLTETRNLNSEEIANKYATAINGVTNLIGSRLKRDGYWNQVLHIKAVEQSLTTSILGVGARKYGRGEIDAAYDTVLLAMGFKIQRNVSDRDLELLMSNLLKRRNPNGPLEGLRASADANWITHPTLGAHARLGNDRAKVYETIKLLTGAPSRRQALRRGKAPVAPQGARQTRHILPESITPQEVSRPAMTLSATRDWGAKHGMLIETSTNGAGQRVFRATTPEGVVAAEELTIRDMMGALQKAAHTRQQIQRAADQGVNLSMTAKMRSGQGGGKLGNAKGFLSREDTIIMGSSWTAALVFGVIGVIGGRAWDEFIADPYDLDNSSTAVVVMGVIGALAGFGGSTILGHFARSGMKRPIFSLFKPPENLRLPPEKVKKMMGKSSRKPKKGDTFKAEGGPTERQFLEGFSPLEQVQHYLIRMRLHATRKGVTKEEAKSHMHNSLRRNIPMWIPDEKFAEVQAAALNAAVAVGYTEKESIAMWIGAIVRSADDIERRGSSQKGLSLFQLASGESPMLFGPNAQLHEVAVAYNTAAHMAGPHPPAPSGAVRAIQQNYKPGLTPDSEDLMAVQETAAGGRLMLSRARDGLLETGDAGPLGILKHGFRSPESFRSRALRFLESEDKKALGQDMLSLYDSVMSAMTGIGKWGEEWNVRLEKLWAGIPENELEQVVHLMSKEGRVELEAMRLVNRPLYEATTGFRKLMDDLADTLGIPPQQRWQDYLPWIYNAKTLKEMIEKKAADPRSMYVGYRSGTPEHKIFNHGVPRKGDEPLGPMLTDPREIGQIYINGAVRKWHIDNVLGTHNKEWFENFARTEPFIASDMSSWMLDAFGIPGMQHMKSIHRLRASGITLSALARAASRYGLNTGGFIEAIAEKYFYGQGVGRRFSNFARGFEFHSKLGGNFISPLINLSQLYANTGADIGLFNSLIKGGIFALQVGEGYLAEKVAGSRLSSTGIGKLFARIDHEFQGIEKLRMARSIGVLSDNTKRLLDNMNDTIRINAESGFGTKVAAMLTGAVAGSLASDAIVDMTTGGTPTGAQRLASTGGGLALGQLAITSALFGKVRAKKHVKIFRQAMSSVKAGLVFPFSAAEVINRLATAGGAEALAKSALKVTTKAGRRAEQLKEAAGTVALFTGTAPAVDAARKFHDPTEDPDFRGSTQIGAAIGTVVAAVGRKRTRGQRARKSLARIEEALTVNPGLRPGAMSLAGQLKAAGSPSKAEVRAWFVRQTIDQTQFRFGKEGRAKFFRTGPGEIIGSLQSFTINQIEFTGERIRALAHSMTRNMPNPNRVPHKSFIPEMGRHAKSTVNPALQGELDIRFFRHLALVAGAGAALTLLAGNLGSDKSHNYWISRIGLGFMPFLHYNESAETWQLNDIPTQMAGPVWSDAWAATTTIFHLMTDQTASRRFDEQIDELATGIFTAFDQMPDLAARVGQGMTKLGFENLGDSLQRQTSGPGRFIKDMAEEPFSKIVGTPGRFSRGGGLARGGGFGENSGGAGGFGGSSSDDGPFGGGGF